MRAVWWRNTRGEWYVVFQLFLFALIAVGPGGIDLRPTLPDGARLAALGLGFLLGAVGFVLAMTGLFSLGDNLSIFPHPKDDAALVQAGPYALVRHPIYSGLIIGAAGWALIHTSLLTLIYAGILLVFFDRKSRREERMLAQKFPEYAAYQARVSKLIPFVY